MKPLKSLISSHYITKSGFRDWMKDIHLQNGFILFNTAQKCQYGAFKSMQEGEIDLIGPSPFLSTLASNYHAVTAASVALKHFKQPYMPNHNSNSDLSMSLVSLYVSLQMIK
jgi:hypothetical protein